MSPWLEKGCREMGIMLPRQSLDRLAWYCRELTRWNRKFNLIARAGEKEIVERHFLDSLAVLPDGRLASGGSDFHGANSPGVLLGRGLGRLAVPRQLL
ncbi:MAG: RsmG family class I SAM-dependent methyltransferase, partial [Thermodesulfobacteriota bacterium]